MIQGEVIAQLTSHGWQVSNQYSDGVARLTKEFNLDEVGVFVGPDGTVRPPTTTATHLASAELHDLTIQPVSPGAASYRDALQVCSDWTEGLNGDNPEYERGQLELIADLFSFRGVDTADRIEQIAADIRNLAARQA